MIYKYPALLLTPVFSIWTFGPFNLKNCFYCQRTEHKKYLKISFAMSWGNFTLTAFTFVISCLIIYYFNFSIYYSTNHMIDFFIDKGCGYTPPIGIMSLLFQIITLITLLLIQFCKNCNCCFSCNRNWCHDNCFPILMLTMLDPENLSELLSDNDKIEDGENQPIPLQIVNAQPQNNEQLNNVPVPEQNDIENGI